MCVCVAGVDGRVVSDKPMQSSCTLSISRLGMLSKLRRENSRASVWASCGWNMDCVDDDLEPESTKKELDFVGDGV